jgi:hypothetical protein
MTAKELIEKLQKVNPDARVLMGYDGNIVITKALEVEELTSEDRIGDCWWSAKVGDVVILEG